MITVLLYGFLGKKYGKVHRFDIKTPIEAIKALSANYTGFAKDIIDGGAYKILRGGRDSLKLEDLANPQSTRETIRIVPVVQGAGGGGWGNVILGAALMIAMPQLSPWLAQGMGIGQTIAGFEFIATANALATTIGTSMILGGVAQILFAPPNTTRESQEAVTNKPSYAFNGAVNTIAQGNPIPLCYGKLRVGSQVISAGLSVEQIEGD